MLRISPVMHIGQQMPNQHIKPTAHAKPKQETVETFEDVLKKAMDNK